MALSPPLPSPPPDGPRATAPVPLRFEDVTQDGRLVLEALPNALAATMWRGSYAASDAARALYGQGIVPILMRLRLVGTDGPFSAMAPVDAEATFRLARADDGRFVVDMWADLYAPIGRTYPVGPSGERDGERALAGRVLAEHVLTRPFAAAGERRVTSLSFPGAPQVGARREAPAPFESVAALPPGAEPLEPQPREDPAPIAFGLVHTDSNHHVNSLVYLRLFEEACLRRFRALGHPSTLLARELDIAYRKPCFAGQSARIWAQAYELEGTLGAVVVLRVEGGGADARPHAVARLGFASAPSP